MTRNDKPPEVETLERTRRIETRLTTLLIALGVDTRQQRPKFDPGNLHSPATVVLPSPHSSIREAISSIPDDWHEPVEVFLGSQRVAILDCVDRSAMGPWGAGAGAESRA